VGAGRTENYRTVLIRFGAAREKDRQNAGAARSRIERRGDRSHRSAGDQTVPDFANVRIRCSEFGYPVRRRERETRTTLPMSSAATLAKRVDNFLLRERRPRNGR